MNRTQWSHGFGLVLVSSLLGACQTAPGNDGGTDVLNGDAAGDSATPSDTTNPNAPLSYMPAGCTYTVTTTAGTRANQMGDNATFGATPTPHRVHVNWASDPSTTAAFLWQTDDAETLAAAVQYGTSQTALTQTAIGHITTGGSGSSVVHMHEVHVCGLTPDTTYYYQVGGTGNWSAVQQFRTAPAPGQTDYDVNFAVAGDSRDNYTVWQGLEQMIMNPPAGGAVPDFQVFTGDAVDLGTVQSAWNTWFDDGAAAFAQVPFIMAQGNHEALAVNYLVQIAQPQVGNPQQDELYFSENYGPIHFIVLNDTPSDASQITGSELTWLNHDLAQVNRTATPWVIVVHHKPPFSSSMHSMDSDTLAIRAAWPPAYDTGQVDLVFSGHDHDFEITYPIHADGSRTGTGAHGTIYVTSGGAGADQYMNATSPFTEHSEETYNFLRVHVTNHMLTLGGYHMDGSQIDFSNGAGMPTVTLTR